MWPTSVGLNASVLRTVLIVFVIFNPGFDFHVEISSGQYKLNMLVLMPANTTEAVANWTAGAVLVALNSIDRRGTLHDVGVDWHVEDPRCSPSLTAIRFYNLWKDPKETPHVIIGGYCEKVCELLALISHTQKLPFLGIGCKTNSDRNHVVFPNFITMDYDEGSVFPVLYALMETFEWRRLVILTTTDESFFQLGVKAKTGVEAKGWTAIFMLTTMDSVPDRFTSPEADDEIKLILADIKKQARIIFFVMHKLHAARILVLAQGQGMCNGEYAFIGYGFNVADAPAINSSEEEWRTARVGLFSFVPANIYPKLENDRLVQLVNVEQNRKSPEGELGWIERHLIDPADSLYVNYAGNLYIAIRVYAFLVNDTLTKMKNTPTAGSVETDNIVRNGTLLLSRIHDIEAAKNMLNKEDHLWMIHFDQSGMRHPVWLLNNSRENDGDKTLFTYDKVGQEITEPIDIEDVKWPGAASKAPLDGPTCGWDGEKCQGNLTLILIWTCSVLGVLTVAGAFVAFYVTWRTKSVVERRTLDDWRVQWSQITVIGDNVVGRYAPSEVRQGSSEAGSTSEIQSVRKSVISRLYTLAGIFREKTVAIRKVTRDSVDILQPAIYNEMKQLFYISHENVNPFIGVCSEAPNVCVLMLYADRGSLQDVLAEPKYDINWEFRMCFATDIAMGMQYLHQSAIGPHGHLRSSNCVVDHKWGCRITDYGLQQFRRSKTQTSNFRWNSDLLWTAPEILKKPDTDPDRVYGTKEGDVYSFGIIVYEIITKEMPYQTLMEPMTSEEVVRSLTEGKGLRPVLPTLDDPIAHKWNVLATFCWDEIPELRPTFKVVRGKLRQIVGGKVPNLMHRMQTLFHDGLKQKQSEIETERRKSKTILYNLLPKSVADDVMAGNDFRPKRIASATICLCETTGILAVKSLTPVQITEMLTSLYRAYDVVLRKYNATQLSSIGTSDLMLLGCGLPQLTDKHAEDICELSLDLMREAAAFKSHLTHKLTTDLKISVHTGDVIAAVIGDVATRYYIIGDTAHTLIDLHNTRKKDLGIRISETTHDLISKNSNYTFEHGENLTLKYYFQAPSTLKTFWLFRKSEPHKSRPSVPKKKKKRRSSPVKTRKSARVSSVVVVPADGVTPASP